jgi:sec-independent protein translocase protein TatA
MSQLLMINLFGMPGGPELIIITLIVLLLFGGKKIPELMRGLGKGIREFNNAKANIQSEINEGMKEIDEPKQEAVKKPESKVEIVEGDDAKADKA